MKGIGTTRHANAGIGLASFRSNAATAVTPKTPWKRIAFSVRSHKGEIRRIPLRVPKGFCRSSRNVIYGFRLVARTDWFWRYRPAHLLSRRFIRIQGNTLVAGVPGCGSYLWLSHSNRATPRGRVLTTTPL